MSSAGRVAKNTTYLTVASILQKVISFGYYAYLAKSIGADALGQYRYALTFTSIFIIFMDFGLGPVLTREGAKDEQTLPQWWQRVLSLKLVLILVTLPVLAITINVFNWWFSNVTSSDVKLVYLASLIIIFDTLAFAIMSAFRALKKIHYEALGIILYQGTIVAAGVLALRRGWPLEFVIGALLVGSVIQFVYLALLIKIKTELRFKLVWDWTFVKRLLQMSAPFAMAGIIFRLSGSIDSMMLKTMAGNRFAGWYDLAFRLTFALTVLPGAFATSYFPAVSSYFKSAPEKLHTVFENGLIYTLVLSLPIVAAVLILGDNIIYKVWGVGWEASIKPLWLLMMALPFVFINYPIGNFLNAVGRQTLNTINMLVSLIINVVLNYFLVPYYTFNGAAVAVVVASVTLVVLGLPWVYKIARFDFDYILKKIYLIGAAAGMMGLVLYFVQDNYPLLVLMIIGGIIYFSALLLLGGLSSSELFAVKKALFKKE